MDNIYKNIEELKLTEIITDKKNRDYFQISLTAGVLLIFLAFAIRPSLVTFMKTRKDISEYKKYSADLETKIQHLNGAKNIYDRNQNSIELLDKAIPLEPEDDKLISSLDYHAIKNLLIIENLNFGYSKDVNPASINFSITATGAYTDIEKFLADLDNILRTITVESLEIKPEEENNSESTTKAVTAVIKGKAYYSVDLKMTDDRETLIAPEDILLPKDIVPIP